MALKDELQIMIQEFKAFTKGFEPLKEEQKTEDLSQTTISDRIKDRFLTIYVLGSLLPICL